MAAASLLVLPGLVVPATAGAKMASPTVRMSLSLNPDTVSWPMAPGFEQRLEVLAGTHGLDGILKLRYSGWPLPNLLGSPFRTEAARLEGPGTLAPLAPASALNPAAAPGRCYRGYNGPAARYRFTLGPRETTTVVVESLLAAPPLPGMNAGVGMTIATDQDAPADIDQDLGIRGAATALINTRFAGASGRSTIRRSAGRRFRLAGRTVPALASRRVRITARRAPARSPVSLSGLRAGRTLAVVRTDRRGHFRTGALRLNRRAIWTLGAALVRPGRFDSIPSCAGSVIVGRR